MEITVLCILVKQEVVLMCFGLEVIVGQKIGII